MQLAPSLTALAIATTLALGCSSKPEPPPAPAPPGEPAPASARPAPPPNPAAPVPAAGAEPSAASLPADFPPECVAYAALIEKLKTCDKLAGARDGLIAGYDSLRSGWPAVPPEQRGGIDAQCKTQADSLRSAAAATCSW